MSSILPANRVAAIAAFLTGLASFISGITQALPSAWQNYALAAVGVIGSVLTVLHFMSGSQKFDALTLGKLAGGVVRQVESATGTPYTYSGSGTVATSPKQQSSAAIADRLVPDSEEFAQRPAPAPATAPEAPAAGA